MFGSGFFSEDTLLRPEKSNDGMRIQCFALKNQMVESLYSARIHVSRAGLVQEAMPFRPPSPPAPSVSPTGSLHRGLSAATELIMPAPPGGLCRLHKGTDLVPPAPDSRSRLLARGGYGCLT
jgi:hypothetical protein